MTRRRWECKRKRITFVTLHSRDPLSAQALKYEFFAVKHGAPGGMVPVPPTQQRTGSQVGSTHTHTHSHTHTHTSHKFL